MAVHPLPSPCWAVDYDDEHEGHFRTEREANEAALERAVDLTDTHPEPPATVRLLAACCWLVVCPGCKEPIDDDDEVGNGAHYPLALAEQVNAEVATVDDGLCGHCANAALYGSVAAANGAILPDLAGSAPEPTPAISEGQLPLPGLPEETR